MKKIKNLFVALFSLVLVCSLSSCSGNKYDDGKLCGDATVEGTNTYSQIRRYYVEQYVYELNMPTTEESTTETYKIYKDKYDENLNVVAADADNYKQAHYLFYYYYQESKNDTPNYSVIENIINSNITDATASTDYYKIVKAQALESGKNSYKSKVESMDYDGDKEKDRNNKEISSVQTRMTSHSKACIVFEEGFKDQDTGVEIPVTTWKDAWNEGFLTGLFVWPVAALINVFVKWFGYDSGIGQVFAILVVTALLKIIIFLLTFKSQSSTQKMQDIQPELLKLQAKYGQSPTPDQRQKMAMEMMAIYQKYGVKPFAPFVSLIITFPVFISMYRAVTYLGILRKGMLGQVVMGNNLNTYIIGNFRWEALIIFIIMAGSQILTMKLPNILNNKRMTAEAKKQQSQTNTMTNVMMIMILVMGFMMPVTMSIYWIASALVSIAQTLIMHKVNNAGKNGKFKMKKQETKTEIPQGYKSN